VASILKFEVIVETNGLKALELLKTQDFDLFFVDVMMPEIGGVELAEQIFKRVPNPKIVLMSGAATLDAIPKEIRLKIQFLSKPFTLKNIEELINNI
jgi:DNA-binding NtrC family response regulator